VRSALDEVQVENLTADFTDDVVAEQPLVGWSRVVRIPDSGRLAGAVGDEEAVDLASATSRLTPQTASTLSNRRTRSVAWIASSCDVCRAPL
jgi:hypothetical protein